MLALGFIIFAAATAALVYVLQPETLRIAVGPLASEDHQVVQAMAEAFEDESRTVRISPITTGGAAESLALMGAGKADLAVGRSDLAMPADAQTLAVLPKNFVVLWSASGRPGKTSKKKAGGKIDEIADLSGTRSASSEGPAPTSRFCGPSWGARACSRTRLPRLNSGPMRSRSSRKIPPSTPLGGLSFRTTKGLLFQP